MSDLPRPTPILDDNPTHEKPPLCVDLDDTLLRTDLLYETFLLLLKHSPRSLALIPFWLVKGRAYVKQQASRSVAFAVESLPYRADLLSYLHHERDGGRKLILVTAADELIARKVQEHLLLFHEIVASNGAVNLKGKEKAKVLEGRFGRRGFDYAGDSRADLAVWRYARRAVVISDSQRFIATVNSIAPVEKSFPKREGRLSAPPASMG